MHIHSRSWPRTAISPAFLSIGISLLIASVVSAMGSSLQRDIPPRSQIGLEIRLTDELSPTIRLGGSRGSGGMTLIHRRFLRINDPLAAGDLSAVDVRAEVEGDVIKVTLSIIYNDLSNQEWWKDKKEKFAGSHLIRKNETVRPDQLAQFGIEPFEMTAIDATPVVLKPGEVARITENAALKVEKLEKHLNSYIIWLKNVSDKNIVSYFVSAGNNGIHADSASQGGNIPVLAAGATATELHFSGPDVERSGIEIKFVMFDDGSFEGDSKLATQFIAVAEGVRVQSPSVLRMIEQTLEVDDSDLRTAFVKLESQLWLIPEALDKPSSIQFLKTKFPAEDEKSLIALYEVFKGGLYDGRNIALSSLGETLRTVQRHEEQGHYTSAVESIRRTLEGIKKTFEKITSAPR